MPGADTNTGHRDKQGRAIFRGPRGGLYILTEGGARGKPSFGRESNRAGRANLAEAHSFFHSGGHPSRNRSRNRSKPAPKPRAPPRAPPLPGRPWAGHVRPKVKPVRPGMAVVPLTLAEIHASLPRGKLKYCVDRWNEGDARDWFAHPGLGPYCRQLTRRLMQELLDDNGGKVTLYLAWERGDLRDLRKIYCDRKFQRVELTRVDMRKNREMRSAWLYHIGHYDDPESVAAAEAEGLLDVDVHVKWDHGGDDTFTRSTPDPRRRFHLDGHLTDLGGGEANILTFVKEVDRAGAARRIQAAVRGHQERKRHVARLEEAYAPGGRGFQLARNRFHAHAG